MKAKERRIIKLRKNLKEFLDKSLYPQKDAMASILSLRKVYMKWCAVNGYPAYSSIESFRSKRIKEFLENKGYKVDRYFVSGAFLMMPEELLPARNFYNE